MSFEYDLSSSSSSSLSDLGISYETSSGIHLCEIDSLENVFAPQCDDSQTTSMMSSREAVMPGNNQYMSGSAITRIAADFTHSESGQIETRHDSPTRVHYEVEDEAEDLPHQIFEDQRSTSPEDHVTLLPVTESQEAVLKYWDSEHSITSHSTVADSLAAITTSFWSTFLSAGITLPTPPSISNHHSSLETNCTVSTPLCEQKVEARENDTNNTRPSFHVFESITPEPLTDEEEYDEKWNDEGTYQHFHEHMPAPALQYECRSFSTVSDNVVTTDTLDEIESRLLNESDTNFNTLPSNTMYHAEDAESQVVIRDSLSTDEIEVTDDEEFLQDLNYDYSLISDETEDALNDCQKFVDEQNAFSDDPEDSFHKLDERDSHSLKFKEESSNPPAETHSSTDDVFTDAQEELDRKKSSQHWQSEELTKIINSDDTDLISDKTGFHAPEQDQQNECITTECDEFEQSSKSFDCVSRFGHVIQRMFQMHIPEVEKPHQTFSVHDLSEPGLVPAVPQSELLPHQRDHEVVQALESLIDGDLSDVSEDNRWSRHPDYVDVLCVELNVPPLDPDEPPQKVALKFPVHKDDANSAMVLVNNVHLQRPGCEYVQTTSEISYYFRKSEWSGDGKSLIDTFRICSNLTVPVSFKLTSVNHVELIPALGVISPREAVDVNAYANGASIPLSLEQLKIEGILIAAAPFVFNRNRSKENLTLKDVREFWGKFCGPRFRYAQTKFIPLHVYNNVVSCCTLESLFAPALRAGQFSGEKLIRIRRKGRMTEYSVNDEESTISMRMKTIWKFVKHLNPFKVVPQTHSHNTNDTLDAFRWKTLSPLGQIIVRRRRSLMMDAERDAETLNNRRTSLTIALILLVTIWTWYYFCVHKPELERLENALLRWRASYSWWGNTVATLANMWFKGT